MKRIQEAGITLEELLDRARALPGNFSVYYNPEKLTSVVYLDGDKYVDENSQPIKVKRCSAGDFINVIQKKIDRQQVVQVSLF